MIRFTDELTPEQVREATYILIQDPDIRSAGDVELSDRSYHLFQNKFPDATVTSKTAVNDTSGRVVWHGVIENNAGASIWKSSVGDGDSYMAYLRAQLHWLMPEGFDCPD